MPRAEPLQLYQENHGDPLHVQVIIIIIILRMSSACAKAWETYIYKTRNRSLSNIGRARCAAINSDFFKIIISKYINYTIGINDNNCVFVCNLILGW